MSVGGSGVGLLRAGGGGGVATLPGCCWKSPSGCVCWGTPPPGGAANPAGPVGPVVAGGSDGPCETLSPIFHKNLDPLEHSVLDHAGPAGRHIDVGPVGPFMTLLSSDCHLADPAGPYVGGGLVGPDDSFKVLEPLEHSVLDHADPAGQHVAVGPIGQFRTLFSSDCHPVGPAGPYVAEGPVGPDELLKVLEPLEHSVLDHADPAGQHAVVQDVLEPLEHSVLDTALDCRPMEGITVLEPLKHSVLDMTLDGGHLEEMSDWEPLAPSLLDVTLDGLHMEGIPDPEPLENSVLMMALDSGLTEGMSHLEPLEHSVLNAALERPALGVSLDSGPTEWVSCPEPLEQWVLDSSLATQPVGCVIENVLDWEPLRNPATSYTLDSRLMEGITNLERTALWMSLDSRPTEGAPCREPLEQSVLRSSLAARSVEGVAEKVSDRKPVINPVQNINPYGRPVDGIAYPEYLTPAVSLDSRFSTGMLQAKPLPMLVQQISLVA